MAVVVVGGHTRNIGKTSVMSGLIAATSVLGWTAVKITQFGHGICSVDGKACGCATADHQFAVTEERNTNGSKDTSRYLAAGAVRSVWVRVRQGQLFAAMDRVRSLVASSENVILESNSVLQFLRPDLYVAVLDGHVEDFKSSARRFLDRADLVLWDRLAGDGASWQRDLAGLTKRLPIVPFSAPNYLPTDALDFVLKRLGLGAQIEPAKEVLL